MGHVGACGLFAQSAEKARLQHDDGQDAYPKCDMATRRSSSCCIVAEAR